MDVSKTDFGHQHIETVDALRAVSSVCTYLGYTPMPGEVQYYATESLVSRLKMNERGVFSTSCDFERVGDLDFPSVRSLILTRQGEEFVLIGNESGGMGDRFTWFVANRKNFAFVSRLNLQREVEEDINQNSLLRSFELFDDLAETVKDAAPFPGRPFICAQEIFTGTLKKDLFYIVDGKILPAGEFEKVPVKFGEFMKFCAGQ